jgi:putative oxidoreductase
MAGRGVLWTERLCRWTIAGIFLAAAIPKIMDPSGFAADISHYAMLPDALINPLAVLLPWVEAVMGLALLSGFAAEGAISLASILMVAFLAAMAQAWIRGLDIECGCFGHTGVRGRIGESMLRDAGFLLIALSALVLRTRRNRTSR